MWLCFLFGGFLEFSGSVCAWHALGVDILCDESLVRLRVDLAYDGTDFHGWAVQPGLRTVQGVLERAIADVLRLSDGCVRTTVAGRTDAGVHARAQVVHVDLPSNVVFRDSVLGGGLVLSAARLNARLGRGAADVWVRDVSVAGPGFDARFSALERSYEYRLWPEGALRDPLEARFTAVFGGRLSVLPMREAALGLLGLRDFAAFCKRREGATTVRTLFSCDVFEGESGLLLVRLSADAFCHSMVRSLVGGLVAVGCGRLSVAGLLAVGDAGRRGSGFAVMPARGLALTGVRYPPVEQFLERAEQTRARRV